MLNGIGGASTSGMSIFLLALFLMISLNDEDCDGVAGGDCGCCSIGSCGSLLIGACGG